MSRPSNDPRVIHEPDSIGELSRWGPGSEEITTINLGRLDAKEPLTTVLPSDLATRFPNLTHLRLWRLDIRELPVLPEGLKWLEVRKCPNLGGLPELPAGLEVLVLEELPELSDVRLTGACESLWDLSLKGCPAVPERVIHAILEKVPGLRELDLSGTAISGIRTWPPKLERIEINGCERLEKLAVPWPDGLLRLGLRGTAHLKDLGVGRLPKSLDYLDLRGMRSLRHLPPRLGSPRTLFIHGSGLELPNELFGENDEHNAAAGVWAHLDSERATEHEVKLILLGNGRCGKSSLARRLVEGKFDRFELSTHGIRLWTIADLPFTPEDAPGVPSTVDVNVWDFAGQDFYHNAHRMFFQSKAIFLLCDTAAGDGADPATDGPVWDDLPPGWDVDRYLAYWRAQVESLGPAPGLDGPAPMLVVRTKCDRDDESGMKSSLAEFQERNGKASEGLESVAFSAKTGEGQDAIRAWIAAQAARVLGPKGKRELTLGALRVKAELRALMAENEKAHVEAERAQTVARPPHPTMPLREAKTLVTRCCANEAYGARPELLLDLLHLSGFLFYQPEHLPDEVILDQRWAIKGMYAAFDRKSAWPRLKAKKGRFFVRELREWGWDKHKYSHDEQRLFLRFMESCGMAYPLGQRGDEMEYVMPCALPENSPALEREAADYRAGLPAREPVVLKHPSLSRDSMLELIVRLGREWGRDSVLWLWGGQFQSYRRWRWDEDLPRTFVYLNWTATTSDSYGGTLVLTQYGEDDSFLAAVLTECRELGGFQQVGVPVIEVADEPEARLGELRLPTEEGKGRGDIASHKTPPSHAALVEVGISFAGDQSESVKDWRDLPENSIERWPLALAALLRDEYGFRVVEDYRAQQNRDPDEQEPGRKEFMDTLVSRDFVFVFISNAYLHSPWCMYEFLKVFERCSEDGKQRTDLVRIGRFSEARWSQTSLEKADPVTSFSRHWKQWYRRFTERLDERIAEAQEERRDINAHERELNGWAYADWARCVAASERFNAVKDALKDNGWKSWPIERNPSQQAVREWAQLLNKKTARQMYLFERAEAAWEDKLHDRAQRLFVVGYLGEDPDGQPEGLQNALKQQIGGDPNSVLNQIRRGVDEKYRCLLARGRSIKKWQELADAIAPRERPQSDPGGTPRRP